MTKPITLVHLYPEQMNIYGDWGNVLTLARRLEWYGYQPQIIAHHPGKPFPKSADIVIGGGGQDSGQGKVQDDLLAVGDQLKKLAEDGTPMLMICGLYQLFGRFFETRRGERIQGIGIFAAETYGGPTRLIGNTVTRTDFGELVGYENHSGLTVLDDSQLALGRIVKGGGNNGKDKTEGARYRNVFGTYLHGSLLPKNPALADAIIEIAVQAKYGTFEPSQVIDDSFATRARAIARSRPR
jgi:lipid II isoglutaminyl synthase (glutamine-hydrolysing)